MDNSINIQIKRNNIRRFISLSRAILYIEILLLVTVDFYNYLNGIWEQFPSQFYAFLIHITSIPILLWLIPFNKKSLKQNDAQFSYNVVMFLNILLYTPFVMVYYYWDVTDYSSSGIFLIFIFVIGFMVRVEKKEFYFFLLYFVIIYFVMLIGSNITYTINPSLYLNGLSAILMYYLISPYLYKIESENIKNKLEISTINKDLKALNKEMNVANHEMKAELKNKLLLLTHNNNVLIDINEIAKDVSKDEEKKLKEIKQILNEYNNSSIVEKIEERFLEVYDDFVKILSSEYPGLSVSNIKLCIFIKLGLDAKEIANLKSISPESVRVARSRLYKHFEIDYKEINLFSFLNALEAEE